MGAFFKILAIIWASPTTLVGFLLLLLVSRGTRIRWVEGALEVWGPSIRSMFQRLSPIDAGAMVLGHFVFGTSSEMLAAARRHERIHIRQVECWGPFFLPAYLLASAVIWLRGRDFYRDNPFEKQAYALGGAGDWDMVQADKENSGVPVMPLVGAGGAIALIGSLAIGWFVLMGHSVSPVYTRHMNRGVVALEQFDYASGVEEYRAALKNRPGDIPARVNLAIALLNQATETALEEASTILKSVLAENPNQPWACYSLAMILQYRNDLEGALKLFRKTAELEPGDPHAWYQSGKCLMDLDRDPEESRAALEKALHLEPSLNAARYALAMHPLTPQDKRTLLLDEQQALIKATWEREYSLRYIEMGRFAEAMPWNAAKATPQRPVAVVKSTGVVLPGAAASDSIASVDINGDEHLLLDGPTLQLLHAVDWSDATEAKGLARVSGKILAVADLNNDGASDLILANDSGLFIMAWLEDRFIPVAGPSSTGTIKAARTIDIDQDGDLDLVLVKGASAGDAALELWINVGESPPGPVGRAPGGLSWRFERRAHLAFASKALLESVIPLDVDGDGDLDLVLIPASTAQVVEWIRNDRLLRFERLAGPELPWNPSGPLTGLPWIKGPESSSELVLAETAGKACAVRFSASTQQWEVREIQLQAGGVMHRRDLNNDGVPDILMLDAAGGLRLLPVVNSLLDSTDSKLVTLGSHSEPFTAICPSAIDDWWWAIDAQGALLGLNFRTTPGKKLMVQPTGRRDANANLRTNTNAIGALVGVLAGAANGWDQVGNGSSGIQAAVPVILGTAGMDTADAVRIRWPDAVPQAESDLAVDVRHVVVEKNRKGTSCPVIVVHGPDGPQFVTDCLGGGALGEQGPDGAVRPARPVETVLLPRLEAHDGRFVIELSEPMDEVLYLDGARLIVVDHPAGTEAVPDERMSFTGTPPSGRVMLIANLRLPVRALNREGDCLPALKARDGIFASGFLPRGWLGYAREHYLELEFPAEESGQHVLVMHGGVDYPYPESIAAAEQAGVGLVGPTLDVKRGTHWNSLGEIGFPAGLPKTMLAYLPREVRGGQAWRLRTNMQVHWDQIRLGTLLGDLESGSVSQAKVRMLDPVQANLHVIGFYREITSGPLVAYNPQEKDPVVAQRWRGTFTRPGPVNTHVARVDDHVAICGPGRGIRLEFPADVSQPAPGWTRTFLLRVHGWCKDASVTTRTGGRVDPLPHRE